MLVQSKKDETVDDIKHNASQTRKDGVIYMGFPAQTLTDTTDAVIKTLLLLKAIPASMAMAIQINERIHKAREIMLVRYQDHIHYVWAILPCPSLIDSSTPPSDHLLLEPLRGGLLSSCSMRIWGQYRCFTRDVAGDLENRAEPQPVHSATPGTRGDARREDGHSLLSGPGVCAVACVISGSSARL